MNPPAIHFTVPAPAPSIQPRQFFNVIQAVEGSVIPHKVGFYGLTYTVWRQHSPLPFDYAFIAAHAEHIADLHLRWLERSLKADGYKATVYEVAVCWKYGFEGGKMLFNNPTYGYGRRVEALYQANFP